MICVVELAPGSQRTQQNAERQDDVRPQNTGKLRAFSPKTRHSRAKILGENNSKHEHEGNQEGYQAWRVKTHIVSRPSIGARCACAEMRFDPLHRAH